MADEPTYDVTQVRQLDSKELVQRGDLVTIGHTEKSGFRPYTGAIYGYIAGQYSYPFYRLI